MSKKKSPLTSDMTITEKRKTVLLHQSLKLGLSSQEAENPLKKVVKDAQNSISYEINRIRNGVTGW